MIVSESEHQLVERLGVLPESETALLDAIGEAIVGQGWRDDVEGGRFPAVLVGEQRQEFFHFQEIARPFAVSVSNSTSLVYWGRSHTAVYEKQGYSFGIFAFLMDEMNVQSLVSIHVNLRLILR